MDIKGYISTVSQDPRFPVLDSIDEDFLRCIWSGINSAYKIYRDQEHNPKHHFYSISYKNVHKRVQKLLKYGVIDDFSDPNAKHGARNYSLTTKGIICLNTELSGPWDVTNVVLSHQGNILFETFLEPFFEKRTIKNTTFSFSVFLSNYVIECCEITKHCLDLSMSYTEDNQTLGEDLFNTPPIEYMYYKLESSIHSFITRLAILDEEIEDWFSYALNKGWFNDPKPSQGKIFCLANDRQATQELLARDKKFTSALRGLEKRFSTGFDQLMASTH